MRRLLGTLIATAFAILVMAKVLSEPFGVAADGSIGREVYAGNAATATIATVQKSSAWVPVEKGASGDVRWYRLHLNVLDREDRYVIERSDFISEARFFANLAERPIDYPSGSSIALYLRPVPALRPAFLAPDEAVRGQPVYVRESGGAPAQYRVLTFADYTLEISRERLFFGLFFGVLVAVGVYHLLMFAVLGGGDFLSYGLYIAALVVQQLASTHYIETLAPKRVIDANLTFWLTYALFAYASYWLVRSFLQTDKHQPRLDRAMHTIAILITAASLAANWIARDISGLIEGLSLLALLLYLVASVRAYFAGLRSSRYFVVALIGLAAGAVASAVWASQGARLPMSYSVLSFGFEIGTVFQAFALALGLADRIAAANEERDRTQRHAIEEMTSLNVAYARFVPRTFLELLGKDDIREVSLGDQIEAEMTVLFSDVRSFTTLSEGMSPADTFAFLNGYLSRTGPLVREHNGIIDKYIGDAIMALFPVFPDDALAAGIALQREVEKHNAVRVQRGRAAFAVGVGLHTGTLMVGTIGEKERMDGTVIADAVNLASRIEGLTKNYRAKILMSDAMRAALVTPDAHESRFLGRVAVKGKTQGVGLFEVLDADSTEQRSLKRATGLSFQSGVAAFMTGDFALAIGIFGKVIEENPGDGAAHYLKERCAELAAAGIAWTGIDHITTK